MRIKTIATFFVVFGCTAFGMRWWASRSVHALGPTVASDKELSNVQGIQYPTSGADFGEQVPGADLSAQLTIRNARSDTVKIVDLTPDCSCVIPRADFQGLDAGQAGIIQIKTHMPLVDGEALVRKLLIRLQPDSSSNLISITVPITAKPSHLVLLRSFPSHLTFIRSDDSKVGSCSLMLVGPENILAQIPDTIDVSNVASLKLSTANASIVKDIKKVAFVCNLSEQMPTVVQLKTTDGVDLLELPTVARSSSSPYLLEVSR